MQEFKHTQAAVIPFEYNSQQVRVIKDVRGSPWWVAKDVCNILNYKNHVKAIGDHLDEDEVTKRYLIDSLGRSQKTSTISESGLYTLILRSNKPEAKPFRRWVTHDVLPALRTTGSYSLPSAPPLHTPDPQPDADGLLVIARELERLNRVFGASLGIARKAGLKGFDAATAADIMTRERTGRHVFAMLRVSPPYDAPGNRYEAVPAFLDACCIDGAECAVSTTELYMRFKIWCATNNHRAVGRQMFYRQIFTHRPTVRKTVFGLARTMHFIGLGLAPEAGKGGDV